MDESGQKAASPSGPRSMSAFPPRTREVTLCSSDIRQPDREEPDACTWSSRLREFS